MIVKYTEVHGNRAASREFDGVSECNVRLWRKLKDRLQSLLRSKMAERGRSADHPQLECKLLKWVTDRRQQGAGVSIAEVRVKALMIAKTMPNMEAFKASRGWGDRFMKRHDLSIRRRTTIAQKLPADFESKLLQFQQFILKMRKQHG